MRFSTYMQLEKVLEDNFENCVVWPSKYNDQILKNYIILVLFKKDILKISHTSMLFCQKEIPSKK